MLPPLRECLESCLLAWRASRGFRLRPWRSPYLLWRIETYSGMDADSVGAGAFWAFLWRERRNLARYMRWAGAMRATRGRPATPRRSPAAR